MWKQILDGSLKISASKAIEEVTDALAAWPSDILGKDPARFAVRPQQAKEHFDASLSGGAAGIAIFYAYLRRARKDFGYNDVALRHLTQAAQAVSAQRMGRPLYGGFTGVAWSIAHLRRWLLDPQDDSTAPIDELLVECLRKKPWRGHHDLISGLVGFGVYALEQLPRPLAIECLKEVIDRLDETAERRPEGIAWFTAPAHLPTWQRQIHPNGHYDLGVAHGVAGIIAFLARVCSLPTRQDRILSKTRAKSWCLLEGAVPWLLAQKLPSGRQSSFPSWVASGIRPEPSRVAWCYGDLGIATALLSAALCNNKADWRKEALGLARNIARRPAIDSGVDDCGLCHGAAGVGHLFNRLFQSTGDPLLKQAARKWFRHLLQMRRTSGGIAGFFALQADSKGTRVTVAHPGLLEGAAGVALALLAAATDFEPNWDRALIVSIPLKKGRGRF